MPSPVQSADASSRPHHCVTCNKFYSTNSHLRRHEAKHTGKNPSTCPYCNRHFSRLDVARRHVKKCSTDGQDVVFRKAKRGKKPRTCDRCSQRKQSCDANIPCARCRSSWIACTYRRLDVCGSSVLPPNVGDSQPSQGMADHTNVGSHHDYRRISISFLLNLTDPSPYGAAVAVTAENINQNNAESMAGYSSPHLFLNNSVPESDALLWDLGSLFPNLFNGFTSEPNEEYNPNHGFPPSEPLKALVLETRMKEIISQLSSTHNSMPSGSLKVSANFNIRLAESVFTTTNLKLFVGTYFNQFHRYIPIIHRPTFDSERATTPLVLAVFLLGSLGSAPLDSAISAREFFDVAEEYIFSQFIFRRLLQDCQEEKNPADNIEVLQAALIIQIMQSIKNDMRTRRRIRIKRHPSLISAMRLLGMFNARRESPMHDNTGYNWQDFISDEIRVRLGVWTFLTDSLLAIFNNNSPEVAISEMVGDFPCQEDIFEAETVADFRLLAPSMSSNPQPPSPSDSTALLFLESQPELHKNANKGINEAHLLIIICALQSITMTSRFSFLVQGGAETILRATDRWKDLWDTVAKGGRNEFPWQNGFVRHAPEFWWFTRTLVNVGQLEETSCRYVQPVPTDSAKELHNFILKYKDL